MDVPVAPGWASVVVYVDVAVVVGAAVLALVVAQRRQGVPGGANRAGLAAAALVGWLGIALALGSAHAFQASRQGIPWIALGIGAPIVVGFVAFFLSPQVRRIVDSIPQAWLLAIHWPRLVGATFLVLLAEHRLPAVFARPAGWGDVLIGLAALPVAAAYLAGRSGSRRLAVAFNLLGLADFVGAIGTGFLASPSPFRLFFSQPSTSLMTVLPLVLIPTFVVPLLTLVHAASLRALLVAGKVPEHSALSRKPWRQPVNRAHGAASR